MAIVHKILGLALILTGLAVGAYFLVYPLYAGQGSVEGAGDIWTVLNWIMAVAVVLLVLVTYHAKRALAEGSAGLERLTTNVRFYLAVVVLLLFLSNWFEDRWGTGEPLALVWVFVDAALPILAVNVGLRVWRAGPAAAG